MARIGGRWTDGGLMALINFQLTAIGDAGDGQSFAYSAGPENNSAPYTTFADFNLSDPTGNNLIFAQLYLHMMDAGVDLADEQAILAFLQTFPTVRIPSGILTP